MQKVVGSSPIIRLILDSATPCETPIGTPCGGEAERYRNFLTTW